MQVLGRTWSWIDPNDVQGAVRSPHRRDLVVVVAIGGGNWGHTGAVTIGLTTGAASSCGTLSPRAVELTESATTACVKRVRYFLLVATIVMLSGNGLGQPGLRAVRALEVIRYLVLARTLDIAFPCLGLPLFGRLESPRRM